MKREEQRIIKEKIKLGGILNLISKVLMDENMDNDLRMEIGDMLEDIAYLNDEFLCNEIITKIFNYSSLLKYFIKLEGEYYTIEDLGIKIKTNIVLKSEEIAELLGVSEEQDLEYGDTYYKDMDIHQVLKEYNEILNIPTIGDVEKKKLENELLPPLKIDNTVTQVVFRKMKYGEIIACFPQSGSIRTLKIEAYVHQGQHISVDWNDIVNNSKLAKECEYKSLKDELESIGYNLRVMKKAKIQYK